MTAALGAALCAALAVSLALPARTRVGVRRVGAGALAALAGGGATLAAALAGAADARALALAVLLGAGTMAALRWRRDRREAARAEHDRDRMAEFCEVLAAEVASGLPPAAALVRTTGEFGELSALATAARLDADLPHAMRSMADRPGWEDLRLVAATWQVSRRSGSALAPALEILGRTVRERRAVARVVAAELAGAYATARLMLALPVVMLLMGSSLGGDPAHFLLRTWPGLVCLAAGLAALAGGMAWLSRIERSVAEA
ncbi:hypothetical protein GCM10027425_27780 [Alteromonas gracilis]